MLANARVLHLVVAQNRACSYVTPLTLHPRPSGASSPLCAQLCCADTFRGVQEHTTTVQSHALLFRSISGFVSQQVAFPPPPAYEAPAPYHQRTVARFAIGEHIQNLGSLGSANASERAAQPVIRPAWWGGACRSATGCEFVGRGWTSRTRSDVGKAWRCWRRRSHEWGARS